MRALRMVAAVAVATSLLLHATSVHSNGEDKPTVVSGIASHYGYTAGFVGQATVALPEAYGGHYTGQVNGYVTVCGDKCAILPVVDFCYCIVPGSSYPQRIVDLSDAAWPLVSSQPISKGLITVTLHLASTPKTIPNTSIR